MEEVIDTWIQNNVPDLTGKKFLVTGANSGLGFEISHILASRNAMVIMSGRNEEKLEEARNRIIEDLNLDEEEGADLSTIVIDLADLEEIREKSQVIREEIEKLDGLINNAGVMIPPYTQTNDGFELQFGVNHLGHFLLTSELIELVESADGRVVTMSSMAAMRGQMRFDDINWKKNYSRFGAYAQSKLANLLFTMELNRRLTEKEETDAIAVAAHPGFSATNLFRPFNSKTLANVLKPIVGLFAMTPRKGSLGAVYAATNPEVKPGGFYGPKKAKGKPASGGLPEEIGIDHEIASWEDAKKLWEISEDLVRNEFDT